MPISTHPCPCLCLCLCPCPCPARCPQPAQCDSRLSTSSIDPLRPIHSLLSRARTEQLPLFDFPSILSSLAHSLIQSHPKVSLPFLTPPIRKIEQTKPLPSLRILICHLAPSLPQLHCRLPSRHRHKHPPTSSTSEPSQAPQNTSHFVPPRNQSSIQLLPALPVEDTKDALSLEESLSSAKHLAIPG